MKNIIFYEPQFDRNIPELAFFGEPQIGFEGYSICGAHMHRHIEIQYLTSGSATFTVDGQRYPLEGNFLFIFPYQIHENDGSADCFHISAAVNPNAFPAYAETLMTCRPTNPCIPPECLPSHFEELLRYTNDLYFDTDAPNRDRLLHDAMSLIIGEALAAMTIVPYSEVMTNHSIPALGRIIHYCVSHIADDLSLSCVAEALYLNKYYISKLFSSTLNMSFVDFVANQRIHTVCERLTAESEPITRIAYECGFRNLSNFNRIFRHLTGMTPREYRNAYSSKR